MTRIFVWLLVEVCVVVGLLTNNLHAQQTSVYTDPDRDYKAGIELLQQEKFSSAQEKFREAIHRIGTADESLNHELLINALYYDAFAASNSSARMQNNSSLTWLRTMNRIQPPA